MPIKTLTLGLAMLAATMSFGQSGTNQSKSSASSYTVRNGDQDWSISSKFGMKPSELRKLNPGVNWNRLQIGQSIRVSKAGHTTAASKSAVAKSATKPKGGGSYTVRDGDNDWVIASRVGTTPKNIRLLNPTINWAKLKPGVKLVVPGSASAVASGAKPAPASSPIRSRYAYIKGDAVSIRRGPTTNSERITTVDGGLKVTVLDRESEWYKLKFPKGTVGWVRGDFLKSAAAPVAVAAKRTASPAKVASRKPAPKAPVAKQKPTTVAKRPVSAPNRRVAMLAGGDVVSRAQAFRGVRYRYGAMTRSATDCSGFTSQVFRGLGVTLPRTSREQSTVGQRVSRGLLSKGDLVFFRTTRGQRVSHVGIYIGNNQFIHASSGGGQVKVSSLGDSYYNNRFVTARRVAKVSGGASSGASSKSRSVAARPEPKASPAKPPVKTESKVASKPASDPTPATTSAAEEIIQ